MTKTNTTNNATVNTNTNASAKKATIPVMSKETMQSKTNKDLRDYIDNYFTDKLLAHYNMTRPNDKVKKADLIDFITSVYDAIRNKNAQTAPVAASVKPAPAKKPVPAKKTTMVKYTKCDDMYHTIDDIRKASEDGYTLLFACFWSPRLLKQFDYKAQFDVDSVPKAFPDNLDVAELLLTCDTMPKLFALSLETEAMYAFREEDLEPVDGIRVSAGLEFEIYQHKDAE